MIAKKRSVKSVVNESKKRVRETSESGQLLAWMVLLLPLFIVLTGLVFDGGMLWVNLRRARRAADGAAVAAASDIDRAAYVESGHVVLTEQALYTAGYYAQENYPGLHVIGIYVVDNTIYVDARVAVEPTFLQMIGVDTLVFNVHGRERPAWGIRERGE